MAGHEVGLDAVGMQALQVFDIEGRRRVDDHAAPGRLDLGVVEMRSPRVAGQEGLGDVPQRRAGGDGHAIRLGRDLGQHVPGVVVEPLGLGVFGMGREGDRAADLQDHLGNGRPQIGHEAIVVVEVARSLARLGVADMDVQHRGAGIVAIDRGLDLLVPAQRQVLDVARQPFRAVRRCRDDQRLHVLGEERVIGEVHGRLMSDEVGLRRTYAPSAVMPSFWMSLPSRTCSCCMASPSWRGVIGIGSM